MLAALLAALLALSGPAFADDVQDASKLLKSGQHQQALERVNKVLGILNKAGVPRYAEIVCVADDPGEAAVVYFVLKLMGWPDVKVLPA